MSSQYGIEKQIAEPGNERKMGLIRRSSGKPMRFRQVQFSTRTCLFVVAVSPAVIALAVWNYPLGVVLAVAASGIVTTWVGVMKRARVCAAVGTVLIIAVAAILSLDILGPEIHRDGEHELYVRVRIVDSDSGLPIRNAIVRSIALEDVYRVDTTGFAEFVLTYGYGSHESALGISRHSDTVINQRFRCFQVEAAGYYSADVNLGVWNPTDLRPPLETVRLTPME